MNEIHAITARGLHKRYGHFEALRGVDLEVKRGEVFGFLGPNGAGKTTTVRCLLDLIRPSAGELRVLGLDPQVDSLEVRRRTGYLPGELHLDGKMNGAETLRYLDGLRGGTTKPARMRELAARLGLDLEKASRNLSKGNKQKIGVVQAFMHEPELLLLDEPTSGLDPLMQQEVLALVREAKQRGATVFFSSHILSEVQAVADRVAIVRRGRVVELAETETLTKRALRHVVVRFAPGSDVDVARIESLPGVKLEGPLEGDTLRLEVAGEMDGLVKALAAFSVVDFETERPSLEEIFMTYYALDDDATRTGATREVAS